MGLVGISTGALADKREIGRLTALGPDLVEVYNVSSSALESVRETCEAAGVAMALHAPVPYDEPVPLRRFASSGPDPVEAAQALRLALATVRQARVLDARYVVVHYPSPYPPYTRAALDRFGTLFLDAVCATAVRENVRVLVENLTPNPFLRLPDEYLRALEPFPALGLCLDLAHARELHPEGGIAGFVRAFSGRIGAVHVRTADPADPEGSALGAFVEWACRCAAPSGSPVLVLEPYPLPVEHLRKVADGLVGLRRAAARLSTAPDRRPAPIPGPGTRVHP